MALTDTEIRGAKPGAKLAKLSDGGGLQMWITPDGAKRWRLAYRFAGRQKLLAIGVYPATSLKDARQSRDEARRLLAQGQDPSLGQETRQGREDRSIGEHIRCHRRRAFGQETAREEGRQHARQARMAFEPRQPRHRRAAHYGDNRTGNSGRSPGVESRGKRESARRLRATIGAVFRYAVATGRADADPTGALRVRSPRLLSSIAPRLSSRKPLAVCFARSQAMKEPPKPAPH